MCVSDETLQARINERRRKSIGIHKPKWLASQQQNKKLQEWGRRRRKGERFTTSKEEKNITRETKRRREKEGIRVDFSLPQRHVQSHLPHPQKS
jgi:hypothetical protein